VTGHVSIGSDRREAFLFLTHGTPRAWSDSKDSPELADDTFGPFPEVEPPTVSRHRVLTAIEELAAGKTSRLLDLARWGMLVRRVISLFAADYLRHPVDYAPPLHMCGACGAPALDQTHDPVRCAGLSRTTTAPSSGVHEKS